MTYSFNFLRRRLTEAVNEDAQFKVVFLAGGTRDDKDRVAMQLKGLPLMQIDSDQAYDFLLGKKDAPENTEKSAVDTGGDIDDDPVKSAADGIMKAHKRNKIESGTGLLVTVLSDDPDMVRIMKDDFEKKGYDAAMIFVSSANNVAPPPTMPPPDPGMDPAPPPVAKMAPDKPDPLNKNIGVYKKMFSDYFFMFEDMKGMSAGAADPGIQNGEDISNEEGDEEDLSGYKDPDIQPKKKPISESFPPKGSGFTKSPDDPAEDGEEEFEDGEDRDFEDQQDRAASEGAVTGIMRALKAFLESPPKMQAARDWYRFHAQKRADEDDPVKRHVFTKDLDMNKKSDLGTEVKAKKPSFERPTNPPK
jgi:hypothetical protein